MRERIGFSISLSEEEEIRRQSFSFFPHQATQEGSRVQACAGKSSFPKRARTRRVRPDFCLSLSPSLCLLQIAERLVRGRLAACVNILPGVTSVYEWEGKIEVRRRASCLRWHFCPAAWRRQTRRRKAVLSPWMELRVSSSGGSQVFPLLSSLRQQRAMPHASTLRPLSRSLSDPRSRPNTHGLLHICPCISIAVSIH